MTHDAIIIGGGLAGLSAAVDLSSRKRSVLLLEQKPHLGGRAYSYIDKKTGDAVDNGQHLLMGCYESTRRYLGMIGSSHGVRLQKNLHIEFLHPRSGAASLVCPPLPAPLHVLAGLLRLRTLPFAHRLLLLRMGAELFDTSKQKERALEALTVDQWLRSIGQTPENRKYLWDILAVGTLNDDPATVSALLFYRVLKSAFLGSRINSSLMIPLVGLSELLVDPAVKYIEANGGRIIAGGKKGGGGVEELRVRHGIIEGVKAGGKNQTARAYIGAIPYHAWDALQRNGQAPDKPIVKHLSRFDSSPIITLHLWFDRQVMEGEFAAVLDSTIQWVFNKSRMMHGGNLQGRQYLSVVISGAGKYVEWPKERLVGLGLNELGNVLPAVRGAKIVQSLVIKEKRATFSPRPGIEQIRPKAESAIPNLFLAGDWTDTGFPATIEGAVMSGFKAARLVEQYLA